MCGIAGILTTRLEGLSSDALHVCKRDLEHRGPDDFGFLCIRVGDRYLGRDCQRFLEGSQLLLVHRRLSILDLSSAGWQPMETADGRYCITFNGEIYNYLELRRELETLGHSFHSHADTEVLLKGYAAWGAKLLPRLIGMFAFAVLDRVENRLFLARDFFGIKPLYYAAGDRDFGFASEIKVLLRTMPLSRRVNAERLYYYMRFGITDHGGETLFQSVRQLPAAHYLEVDLADMAVKGPTRYWRIDPEAREDVSFEEAARTVRELFLENVGLHLRSDVPLGAALSGGIDSSSIVMGMRRVAGDRVSLNAFSFIADEERINEERWIDAVAAASGAHVHKVRLSAHDLREDLRELTRTQDEPTGSSSVLAQRHVFRRARQMGIKVMLDGQGGDELFGGYHHFFGSRLASLLRQRRLVGAWDYWSQASQAPGLGRLQLLALAADNLLPNWLQAPIRRLVGRDLSPNWMAAEWFRERGVEPATVKHDGGRDILRRQLRRSVEQMGLAHLLRYEDRNSMAFSIESRVPFLTPKLASFALSLPEEYIISSRGESKAVFRTAMRGIVPDQVLDRRDKLGFETPERDWLSAISPWVSDILASECANRIPPLRVAPAKQEWDRVVSGVRRFDSRIWRWLSLVSWADQFQVEFD